MLDQVYIYTCIYLLTRTAASYRRAAQARKNVAQSRLAESKARSAAEDVYLAGAFLLGERHPQTTMEARNSNAEVIVCSEKVQEYVDDKVP